MCNSRCCCFIVLPVVLTFRYQLHNNVAPTHLFIHPLTTHTFLSCRRTRELTWKQLNRKHWEFERHSKQKWFVQRPSNRLSSLPFLILSPFLLFLLSGFHSLLPFPLLSTTPPSLFQASQNKMTQSVLRSKLQRDMKLQVGIPHK